MIQCSLAQDRMQKGWGQEESRLIKDQWGGAVLGVVGADTAAEGGAEWWRTNGAWSWWRGRST